MKTILFILILFTNCLLYSQKSVIFASDNISLEKVGNSFLLSFAGEKQEISKAKTYKLFDSIEILFKRDSITDDFERVNPYYLLRYEDEKSVVYIINNRTGKYTKINYNDTKEILSYLW